MTTELTKAAQQALEALRANAIHYGDPLRCSRDAIAALERALTQRPAAQSEAQALAHNMMLWREDAVHHGNEYVPVHVRTLEKVIAQLRDMPAPQQATPERHLTVTTNQQGEAVMVSWQDDEHRILEVVWERKQATPEPVLMAPSAERGGDVGVFREYCHAHMALLAAKQEHEDKSRTKVQGHRTPSQAQTFEPIEKTVHRNKILERRADKAYAAYKSAQERFNNATRAALAAHQSTKEPSK